MHSVILKEFRHHGPFTLLGAAVSVAVMMALRRWAPETLSAARAEELFEFSHPLHVVLSAMVTAAMYKNYRSREKHSRSGLFAVMLIGYCGAIGIATISDCIIPYWAELFLGMEHAHAHIGIIEMPLVINLAALLGIGAAFFSSKTHFPHAGHVLLSTMASLFHVLRAHNGGFSLLQGALLIVFLFIAVWVPCCFSDIAFPLLFTGNSKRHSH